MSLVKINKQQVELTPIDKNYTSQNEMIEDQSNQFVDFIYSDGENFWQYLGTTSSDITDYKSLGGASESAVSVSGYNYIICETVNTEDPAADALVNGVNLITKYAEAVALNIGTPSINNRAVLLLMPGDYDLDDTTLELDPFVDVIGISTNAADTIIRMSNASAGQLTINWQDSDAMVSNVDIRADVANDGIAIGGGNNSYVKLENVIFGSDNPTSNSDGSIKGFNDFNGELNRIRFSELLITINEFLWVDGNINGTFKDIVIGDVTNAFYTSIGDINGTFKNIVIGDVSYAFYAINNIGFDSVNNVVTDTIFENITIGDVVGIAFYAGFGNINGTFKDITIADVFAAFSAGNNIGFDTIFENIVIGDVFSAFFAVADINGTFKNIAIGIVSDAFSAFTDINGTFKNIVIGNVTNDAFSAGNNIGFDTIFENIRIGNVTNNAFYAFTDINGTFKNIVIGNVTNDAFYAGSNIGFDSFNNVVTDTIFENIAIGDVSNYAFYADFNDMNGTFKDIVIGDVSYAFYAINNIGFDSVNNVVTDTIFENITIGDVVGDVFYAVNSDINGTFKNIAIGNVTINAFNAVNSIGFDSVNSVTTDTIFENIVIGDVGSNVFYAVSGDINGTFKNIVVGNVTTYAFYAPSFNDYSNCTFININCAQAFQQDTFNGKIYNTTIDATGLAIDGIRDLASGAIIERCKFIVDSGNVSINTQDILGVTAQILYTITNEGISVDITVVPSTDNYNANDSSIV